MPSIETLTYPFVMAATTLLAVGLLYGMSLLAKFLKGKTHNQFVLYVLTVVEALAAKVVAETYQAYVEPLKAKGNWDKSTQKIAADKALAALKAYLGVEGLAKVSAILGNPKDADDFLRSFLESAVLNVKPVIASSAQPLPPLPSPATDPSPPIVVGPSGPN